MAQFIKVKSNGEDMYLHVETLREVGLVSVQRVGASNSKLTFRSKEVVINLDCPVEEALAIAHQIVSDTESVKS